MQRAGHQRPASFGTTSVAPPSHGAAALTVRLLDESLLREDCDAGTVCNETVAHRDAARPRLEVAIQQRIEGRLNGRVRNLIVRVHASTVTLEGQCATYYTKQLAQHAAMGILEDEQLENAIVVRIE